MAIPSDVNRTRASKSNETPQQTNKIHIRAPHSHGRGHWPKQLDYGHWYSLMVSETPELKSDLSRKKLKTSYHEKATMYSPE